MTNRFLIFIDDMITCKFASDIKDKFNCEYIAGVYSDDSIDSLVFDELFNAWECWEGIYPTETDAPIYDDDFDDELKENAVEILHMMQRHNIPDFDCRVNIYYKHVAWWGYYLDSRKINCVVFGDIPHESFNYVIYKMCKRRGIATVFSYTDDLTGIANYFPRFMMTSIENPETEIIDALNAYDGFDGATRPDLYANYESYFNNRMNNISRIKLMNSGRKREIRRYYGSLRKALVRKVIGFSKRIKIVFSYFAGYINTLRLALYYEKKSLHDIGDEKFIFYALHYEPECTSSPMGGRFGMQLQTIELLSRCVPDDVYVYVKEHPTQIALFRNKEYYDALLRMRNVRLVSQKNSGDYLLKKSIAVATLTGTVIYESQLIGKPCICMGDTVRHVLNKGIYTVKTKKQCENIIKLIESGDCSVLPREELFDFWNKMYNICFDQNKADDVLENYSKLIQKLVG